MGTIKINNKQELIIDCLGFDGDSKDVIREIDKFCKKNTVTIKNAYEDRVGSFIKLTTNGVEKELYGDNANKLCIVEMLRFYREEMLPLDKTKTPYPTKTGCQCNIL